VPLRSQKMQEIHELTTATTFTIYHFPGGNFILLSTLKVPNIYLFLILRKNQY